RVTYELYRTNPTTNASTPAGRSTFVVTGIVDLPPVLGDQFDQVDNAVLPPAATARFLNGEFAFGWVGLRLTAGSAGVPALQRHLDTVADGVDRTLHVPRERSGSTSGAWTSSTTRCRRGSRRRLSRWRSSGAWPRWRCSCWQARPWRSCWTGPRPTWPGCAP